MLSLFDYFVSSQQYTMFRLQDVKLDGQLFLSQHHPNITAMHDKRIAPTDQIYVSCGD